jgi:hypothetical protein
MTEQFADNASSPISGAITALATSLTLGSPAGFPSIGNFRLLVDNEYMLATANAAGVCTVTRGIEGSIASPHANGATATCIVTAGALQQLLLDAVAAAVVGAPFVAAFVPVAAGATVTVAANAIYAADSTGALITFNLPSAPTDGALFIAKFVGASFPNPARINAGAGDIVENPQIPGTFSAVAGQVAISTIGASVAFKYQTTGARWLEFI